MQSCPLHAALLAILLVGCASSSSSQTIEPRPFAPPVEVRVLAFNDLHGNIEGPSGTVSVDGQELEAGGADALAAHIEALRAGREHTAVVIAGDLIGASPLISGLFQDEPTIEVMNRIGVDLLAVGNHEFDEGVAELERLQKGGCHPEKGCFLGEEYAGAGFTFSAANARRKGSDKTLFPPYVIKSFGPVRVGFIGLTLEGTADLVSPDGVREIEFLDEAETINRYAAELKARGIEAIVVVIHEGATPDGSDDDANACAGLSGPLLAINAALDPSIDAVVAGHTHQAFNCEIEGRLVTSAKSYGRLVTAIDLRIDPASGEVIEASAKNHAVTRDRGVAPDERVAARIGRYREAMGPLATEQIGTLRATIERAPDQAGFSPLAGLIADAQLAATRSAGADAALMNLGGVRGDLVYDESRRPAPGAITYEALHRVQPFGNTLVVVELSGAQLEALLEAPYKAGRPGTLQPSANLTWSWRGGDDPIESASIRLDGAPIDPEAIYRITVNSFLAGGGDQMTILAEAPRVGGGALDLDALSDYLRAAGTIEAPPAGRVSRAAE